MPKRRANGEGSIYIKTRDKNGKATLYGASYFDANGDRRSLYAKTQKEVKDKLKEAIQQTDKGIVIESKKISFSDWVEEWLEVYKNPLQKDSTYSKNYQRYRTHIKPYFGAVPLKDIREEKLQKFINEKLEKRLDGKPGGYSIGTVNDMRIIIDGALKKAVDLNYIVRNPAENLKLPENVKKEKRIFTVNEQWRFKNQVLEAMKTLFRRAVT